MFRTINSKFYAIAGILLLLFSINYAMLAFYSQDQGEIAEREQEAVFLERKVASLNDLFFGMRFWEKSILNQEHQDYPEADKKFGTHLEKMKTLLTLLTHETIDEGVKKNLEAASTLLAEYEKGFNHIIQLKTEQRLSRTRMDATYRSLSSSVLRNHQSNLLKPFFILTHFQISYLNFHNKNEYQALKVTIDSFERKFLHSNIKDDRMMNYLSAFTHLLDQDFQFEEQLRAVNVNFDQISSKLMALFSKVSHEVEISLKNEFQNAEKNRSEINFLILISITGSIVLLVFILIFLGIKIVRPVRYISNVMNDAKAGDEHARFYFSGSKNDEIMQLGTALNEMLDSFAEKNRELVEYQSKLETKVSELAERETELKTYQDQLEVLVQNRTRELMKANQGLQQEIVERERVEKEQEILQKQLLQAHKMESVGRLAGGVAHDFNNMLGVILGHTELALMQVNQQHDLYSALKEIHAAANRSANLTKQLLAFARKEIIMPKQLDLNDTVESMLNMLRRLIGEDIDLIWQPAAQLWPVKMDPTQIDQILVNLCINARDAIAGVGKTTIKTGIKTIDEAYCNNHPGFIPGDYVLLAISDNGSGMDKNTLDNLFEPFFTTKELGKGTGLGLATVYGIVKQNNGFIDVYSEPGQDTTFTIYLPPLVKDEEVDKEVPQKKSTDGGTETILLVEDEPSLLRMTHMMMEQKGYTVLSAATPEEAMEKAKNHSNFIDLLVTDMVMPGMNGRDLARQITALYPGTRLLFMSGYTADVISHKGVLDDEVAFIQKPFTRAALAEKLRAVLDTSPCKNQG